MSDSAIAVVQMTRFQQLVESTLNVNRFLSKCESKYGEIFKVHPAGISPYLVVSDPGIVKELYQLPEEVVGDYPANSLVAPIFGRESILFQEGAQLRMLRQLTTGIFREKQIGEFTGLLSAETKRTLGQKGMGERIEVVSFFSSVYRRCVIRLIFGREIWPEFEEAAESVLREMMSVRSIFRRQRKRKTSEKSPSRLLVDRMILREWQKTRSGEGTDFDAILPRLARGNEAIADWNDEVLCDFIYSNFLTGFLPPASATTWSLYALLSDPELTESYRASVDSEARETFLHAVFFESLRYFNPLPYSTRLINRDCELGGKLIAAGTRILIAACLIHKNGRYWNEPDTFQVKRFSEVDSIHSNSAFVPFGGGFHRCLGIHFAPLLTAVCLRSFLDAVGCDLDTMRVSGNAQPQFYAATMRPKGPIWFERDKSVR